MKPKDPAFSKSIIQVVEHDPPFTSSELNQVRTLYLDHVQGLDDLRELPQLKSLHIENSFFQQFGDIPIMKKLRTLSLYATRLTNLEGIEKLPGLYRFVLAGALVEDISPLLQLRELQSAHLKGNPLSSKSVHEIIPTLVERKIKVEFDPPEIWQLNRQMHERGLESSFRRSTNYCYFVGLTPSYLEKVEEDHLRLVVLTPDELREELKNENISAEEIADKYETDRETLKRKQNQEVADHQQVLQWIEDATVTDDGAESLVAFAERFSDATFMRESAEQLSEWGKSRGGVWNKNYRALPGWYFAYRRAIGSPQLSGKPACLFFDHAKDEQARKCLDDQPFSLTAIGAKSADLRRALIDRHGVFPIAYGGKDAGWMLGIKMVEDRHIYLFRKEEVFTWDFDPERLIAFESLAELFGSVSELRPAHNIDGILAALNDEPPEIDFDVAEHQKVKDAQATAAGLKSTIPKDQKEAISNLVEGFPELDFVCEDDSLLEYYEVLNQTRFPEWYREVRKTCAYMARNDRPTWLGFGDQNAGENLLMGRATIDSEFGQIMIEQERLLPICSGSHHFLAIRLDDEGDQQIYRGMIEEVGTKMFGTVKAFDSMAEMFNKITKVQTAENEEMVRKKAQK